MVDVTEDAPLTNRDRLERAFEVHQERLYRLARRMTGSRDEAVDLVQETFLRVARTERAFPSATNSEEAWLVRVLVNACRDQWRRRRVRLRPALVPPSITDPSPEPTYVARLAVQTALTRLTPRRRVIVILHYFECVQVEDIAHMLGVSSVTVRWHLSRARKQLSETLVSRTAE